MIRLQKRIESLTTYLHVRKLYIFLTEGSLAGDEYNLRDPFVQFRPQQGDHGADPNQGVGHQGQPRENVAEAGGGRG